MLPSPVLDCPHCGSPGQTGLFCSACDIYMPDPTGTVKKVTYNRRFWGSYLLEGVLYLVTLIIGWYIWLAFTAKDAQTPAKKLVDVYVLDIETGQPVSAGRIWQREVLVKQLLSGVVSAAIGVAWLIDYLWVLFDRNCQALHDKVSRTVVVYAPQGLPSSLRRPDEVLTGGARALPGRGVKSVAEELRELARLRDEGIITDEEYERKRQELVDRL